jgi:hypothetical protein
LNSVFGLPVSSEYVHPVLTRERSGPGRRPEVDFAVVDSARQIKCVVESKWCGKLGLTTEQLIWDILRLELVSEDTGAAAYFLLAGRKKHLDAFFESKAFKGAERGGHFRRLLKLDRRKNPRIRVDNPPRDRLSAFRNVLLPYSRIDFPSRISTSLCYVYPSDASTFQYQAYAWRVFAPPGTPRFRPAHNKAYSELAARNRAQANPLPDAVDGKT